MLRLHQTIKLRLHARRAAQRVKETSKPNPQVFSRADDDEDDDEIADQTLDRVKIMRVFDFIGVSEAIDELRNDIKKTAFEDQKDVRGSTVITQITHIEDSEDEEDEDLMLFSDVNDEAEMKSDSVSLVLIDNITHVLNPILKADYIQGQCGTPW